MTVQSIQRWHWGKLILAWAAGAGLFFLGLSIAEAMGSEATAFAILFALACILGPVVTLPVLTWLWLTSRDSTDKSA